jgi:hypothetical protein
MLSEELRINGPALVLLPDPVAHDQGSAGGNRFLEGEPSFASDDEAETFIRRPVLVGGWGGGGEPALVDSAPV